MNRTSLHVQEIHLGGHLHAKSSEVFHTERNQRCGMCLMLHWGPLTQAACSDHSGEERSEKYTSVRAAKICASYPILEETGAIEQILPKKEQALLAKL